MVNSHTLKFHRRNAFVTICFHETLNNVFIPSIIQTIRKDRMICE